MDSDKRIRRDVIQSLNYDSRIGPSNIDLEVNTGVLTLSGSVDSYRKKWAATNVAMSVQGVLNVINHINVEVEEREYSNDEIRESIQEILQEDPRITVSDIHVEVSEGTVKLRGNVKTIAIKQLISEDVRWTPGVVNVINELEILPGKEVKDQTIRKKLMDVLQSEEGLHLDFVHIFVKKGVATLSGTVPTYAERLFIVNQSWQAEGVLNVADNLKVQSEST